MNKYVRVASASFDIRVADCRSNYEKICKIIDEAQKNDVKLLALPELSLTGYSCGDIFFNNTLIKSAEKYLDKLCIYTAQCDMVIVVGMPLKQGSRYFNCAVVIKGGSILGVVPKTYVPDNNEYYEKRWFCTADEVIEDEIRLRGKAVPIGAQLLFVDNDNDIKIGIEICEDMWSPVSPGQIMSLYGAQIIVNISASNETVKKYDVRKKYIELKSLECRCGYIYTAGSNSESTTDFVYSAYKGVYECGSCLNESNAFLEDDELCIADIDIDRIESERERLTGFRQKNPSLTYEFRTVAFALLSINQKRTTKLDREPFLEGMPYEVVCERIAGLQRSALIKRMRYMGRDKLIIGISGGLDSTVALLSCVEAIRFNGMSAKNIIGVTMPGPGSSKRTYENALKLMELTGITAIEINISDTVVNNLDAIGCERGVYDITYEQTQSRERTRILMDLANKEKGIVVGTGDLSEIALGWMSYSGDQISMYNINSGIPKTVVRYMALMYKQRYGGAMGDIIGSIIDTPISPELLPLDKDKKQNQSTEKLVGAYIVHDFVIYYMLKYGYSITKIENMAVDAFKNEYTPEQIKGWMNIFVNRFFSRQFKRSCFPDGVQVFDLSLSPRGYWRMPSDMENCIWKKELNEL